MTSSNVSVRFLLFPSQREIKRNIETNLNFFQIKKSLISGNLEIDSDFKNVNSESQIRFIYCGKILPDTQKLEEIREMSKDKNQITIHIVINTKTNTPQTPTNQSTVNQTVPIGILNPIHFSNNNNNSSPQNSPTQEEIEDWGRSIHFHGCFFNEEEAQQVAVVFNKKKGEDNLMEFTDVHMFLRTYWKWLISNHHKSESEKFPMARMMKVKKSVVGSRKRITLEEFRQIFFLFDNNSSTETCPHGTKDRVKRATEELHRSIEPDLQFQNEKFEQLFAKFDKDNDGSLSCCELELFYYIYTLETTQQQQSTNQQNIPNSSDKKEAQEV